MSGFNMPPGVSPSDIPGNRPEDDELPAVFEDLINAEIAVASLITAIHRNTSSQQGATIIAAAAATMKGLAAARDRLMQRKGKNAQQ